jgi:hypothetical protein
MSLKEFFFEVCILATTTRHDAFTLLEKRVRSRFSDTKIRLPTTFEEADKLKLVITSCFREKKK